MPIRTGGRRKRIEISTRRRRRTRRRSRRRRKRICVALGSCSSAVSHIFALGLRSKSGREKKKIEKIQQQRKISSRRALSLNIDTDRLPVIGFVADVRRTRCRRRRLINYSVMPVWPVPRSAGRATTSRFRGRGWRGGRIQSFCRINVSTAAHAIRGGRTRSS